jgi:DNA polymerase V
MSSYPTNVGPVGRGNSYTLTFRFFNSAIPAGFPSPAQDHQEEDIDLSKLLQPNPDSSFVVRIRGNSMQDANIPDGCLAIIDKSIRPYNGAIVVAVLNGEFTIKRFVKQGSTISLHPENPDFKVIVITEDMEFQVWGVITHVIVDLRS